MKVRRQGGATLGLVAACVLLVIVIGVGFYFLSKIIGGGREVANATDAGALNVARQALKRGSVDLSTIAGASAEFGSLTDPPCTSTVNTPVTLVTYNRIVAQAMMVCKNAEIENTTLAKSNAATTAALANQVGAALKASLNTAVTSTLPGDFNTISKNNNTKMWNGNPVSCTAITTGYLKQNGSTNVIFDSQLANTFAGSGNPWYPGVTNTVSNNNNPGTQDSQQVSTGNNPKYMVGYDDPAHVNSFLGGTVKLMGVPVFPNTKPHLIDIGTFNNDTTTNNATISSLPNAQSVPNNAFDATAQAVEAKSGAVGSSLACAVVGVLNKDYVASMPRGFVRISNGPDAYTAAGSNFGVGASPISDGTNDIFNNQLYTPPGTPPGAGGITQDNNTGVFTTTQGYLNAWAAFNARGMSTAGGSSVNYDNSTTYGVSGPAWVGPSGMVYPPNINVPQGDLPTFSDPQIAAAANSLGISAADSISDMAQNPPAYDGTAQQTAGLRITGNCNTFASINDLEGIRGNTFNCNYTMYDDTLSTSGGCGDPANVDNWMGNYQCMTTSQFLSQQSSSFMGTSNTTQGFTNVEYMKAELLTKISGRLGGHYCADVSIPGATPSGVKYFPRGVPGTGGSAEAFDPLDSASVASPVVNFENDASPWAYLTQITTGASSCASNGTNGILDQITARMQQISPTVTSGQVQAALQSQILHLRNSQGPATADNGILYLYVDPTSHNVTMAAQLPSGWTDTTQASMPNNFPVSNPANFPDGNTPPVGTGDCNDQYPLNGWVVNSVYTMANNVDAQGVLKGDAHYHDQPFTEPNNNYNAPAYDVPASSAITSADNGTMAPISGQDNAIFRPSSGAQNLLGELQFTENTQGTTFCKPN